MFETIGYIVIGVGVVIWAIYCEVTGWPGGK